MQRKNNSLEYKKRIIKDIFKDSKRLCYYNDGEIIFRKTDDYKIVGIKDPKETYLKIENQINGR